MFWAYFADDQGAVVTFIVFWFFTGISLAIWTGCELHRLLKRPDAPRLSRLPNRLLKRIVPALLIITGAATWYLATYETPLDAVISGDLDGTRKRLRFNLLGVDVHTGCVNRSTGGTMSTPLLPVAVWKKNSEMVELLLEHGADPSDGIHDAARDDTLDILQLLLDRGTDPTEGIHGAIRFNSLKALQMLLDKGADPFVLDWAGRTPLQVAEERGHTEIADCLRAAIQSKAAEPKPPADSPPARRPDFSDGQ